MSERGAVQLTSGVGREFRSYTSFRLLDGAICSPLLSTAAPSKLAEFEIVRRLGAGGMAEVFLAKKPGAEGTYKLLVLKRILPQQASRRLRTMFIEEAQLATRLNHPNVVQVFD